MRHTHRVFPQPLKEKNMNRRQFLHSCLAAGVGFGLSATSLSGKRRHHVIASESGILPDIVAVRNGEPDAMFDTGIAAMGGMQRFVKSGQTVVIKPNVSWDVPEHMAGNTNPTLLHRVIRHCIDAGAKRVTIFDNCIEFSQRCFETSGIRAAALDAGAVIAPADSERYYQSHAVGGTVLKNALVHETIFSSDVFISLPILKHHGGAGMTGSIKNLMGAVWDRRYYHANGLSQCIADFLKVRKPDLTILDAYRVLAGNGPRSRSEKDVKLAKMQILSTDIVAADASGARVLGKRPESFEHIKLAHAMGFGQIDPTALQGRRISL